jgi:hypothetical protein
MQINKYKIDLSHFFIFPFLKHVQKKLIIFNN